MEESGKVNCYVCDDHGHKTWTINRDEGVTPFMITCKHTDCDSTAKSSFYRVDQNSLALHCQAFIQLHPTLEADGDVAAVWIAPDEAECHSYVIQLKVEAREICENNRKDAGCTADEYFERYILKPSIEHIKNGGLILVQPEKKPSDRQDTNPPREHHG